MVKPCRLICTDTELYGFTVKLFVQYNSKTSTIILHKHEMVEVHMCPLYPIAETVLLYLMSI